jgi:ribosome-binding ATPase YchF (GTP1/OBG family)
MRASLLLHRSAGLVGLPNVGKSTLFNALSRSQLAQASNFPFTTIKPNIADAICPDPNLYTLGRLAGSLKVVPWVISIKDIAGLIAGASSGAGLGNAFLGDIRESAAVVQVVRCYEDDDVIHVLDKPSPARDIGIIENELILADLQSVEKRLPLARKKVVGAEGEAHARWLGELLPLLEAGLPARLLEGTVAPRDLPMWHRLNLLTQKPMLYVANVAEADLPGCANALTQEALGAIEERWREQQKSAPAAPAPTAAASKGAAGAAPAPLPAARPPPPLITLCAKVESELALLEDAERVAYLGAYGLKASGLDELLTRTAELLGLMAYYTTGPQETRAWCIPVGSTLPRAAGAIHSDMERGFIAAEVISFEDILAAGSEKAAREGGRVRSEGKDYIVRSGDVCVFKFKPPQK